MSEIIEIGSPRKMGDSKCGTFVLSVNSIHPFSILITLNIGSHSKQRILSVIVNLGRN